MTTGNRYIERVMSLVWAGSDKLQRLEADLREHFEQGREAGEPEAEVIERLGPPEVVAEEFMTDIELEPARLLERLCAFVGDIGFGLTLSLPFLGIVAFLGHVIDEQGPGPLGVLIVVFLAGTAIAWLGLALLYFPLLEARFGKTLGKHLMRLRVRTDRGAEIGLGAAFIRRLSLYFEILFLDALFVPFTAKRQRAFDIVAKTLVLRETEGPTSASRCLICLATWVPPVLTALTLAWVLGN